jgi:hypothetical protein
MGPSVNDAWRNIPGRGRAKTRLYLDFEKAMAVWQAKNQGDIALAKTIATQVTAGVGLKLKYTFYFDRDRVITKSATGKHSPAAKRKLAGESKRLDVTNFLKCAEDQIFKLLEVDDCYAWEVGIEKAIAAPGDKEFVDIEIRLRGHPVGPELEPINL